MRTSARWPWGWVLGIAALLGGVAWWSMPTNKGVPKPLGQVRITLPDTLSSPYTTPCGTTFRVPNHSKVQLKTSPKDEPGCWYNLAFPRFNAKLHCTEVPVAGQLDRLLKDAHELVMGHEVAATGIRRHALNDPGKSGMLYLIEGPAAAPLQFYVTDSVSHFLRGSLYFAHAPNPDSTAPVLGRIEADVRRLMESLQWP